MRHLRLLLLLLLLGEAVGQTTTVTLTVTDTPDNQTWNNGTYTATYVPPALTNPNLLPTTQVVTGTLSGTGTASPVLASNTVVQGSQWRFTVCPQASSSCFQSAPVTLVGPTQTVALTPPSVRIVGGSAFTLAYADAEITSPATGALYFNLVSQATRQWNGAAWGVLAGALPSGLTYVAPTFTISGPGLGNGAFALSGNTSGVATCTAPAVAGTSTNGVTCTNVFLLPDGTNANTAYGFTGDVTMGMSRSSGQLQLSATSGAGGTVYIQPKSGNTSGAWTFNTGPEFFPSNHATIGDTSNYVGGVVSSFYQSGGTKFTASGCSNSTLLGGASAGSFVSGTTGACAVTVTMGNSDTATTGWSCWSSDHTTPANLYVQTGAASTTTASFTGTTVSGDLITFGCVAY